MDRFTDPRYQPQPHYESDPNVRYPAQPVNQQYGQPANSWRQQQMPREMLPSPMPNVPMPNINSGGGQESEKDEAYQNLKINSAVGGYSGKSEGADSSRNSVDIMKFAEDPREVIKTFVTQELKDDMERIGKFNLIDEERLNQMYVYHDALLMDRIFLVTYLCSEYRQKYEELYSKYPCLEVYVLYVVMILVYESENTLKDWCDINGFVQMPKIGNNSAVKLRFGKRKTAKEVAEEAKRARTEEADKPKLTVEEPHPFYNEQLYQKFSSLFKLGTMTKYCVPSEFAVMFCNASLGCVTVYATGDKKQKLMGIRVAFSKPVVSMIQSRKLKTFNFQSLKLFGVLEDVMTKITGKQVDQEPFRLSSLKQLSMRDLTTRQTIDTVNWDYNKGYNMALVTNFTCTDTVSSILNIRAFSSPIYHVAKNHVDMQDDDLKNMYDKADNDNSTVVRAKQLNEYYDKLESKEVNETLPQGSETRSE